MMKIKSFLFATMFASISFFAQEVKVKKGEIQIDGKSVAKIDKEKNIYTISDLSGKSLFTATITNQTPLKNIFRAVKEKKPQWLGFHPRQ